MQPRFFTTLLPFSQYHNKGNDERNFFPYSATEYLFMNKKC